MVNQIPIIPLKDLNLTNRFLFNEVMEDPQAHRDVLSIIFGREVSLLSHNETEKELRTSPALRSVRMDIYAMDEERTIYNTEMQQQRKADLARRSRYYQAMVDSSLLEPGVPNYNQLNESFIIMIMPFDLFGLGKYRYTFTATCQEAPGYALEDGSCRIFLNTKGTNEGEVSKELANFLHYAEDTTSERADQSGSARIRRIQERVLQVKASEEMGVKYMQAWEERYYNRQEGWEEGHAAGHASGLAEGHASGLAEGHASGLAEGHASGLAEGHAAGQREMLESMVARKRKKGKSEEEIAEELETDPSLIREILAALAAKNDK